MRKRPAHVEEEQAPVAYDPVSHPAHFTSHASGIECIEVTEHFNFCLGNVIKYVWRAGLKSEDPIEDLEKAAWYLRREISRLQVQRLKGQS